MTQDLSRLVREIERVVTAPYVPSLQDLQALVQENGNLQIRHWAIQKPCQVGLLADVLVDAIPRSRMAMPLLSVFASEKIFRDIFLQRHPAIFDGFLERAVEAGGSDYLHSCAIMLSHPLPFDFAVPMRIADLITKLVWRVAESPCADNIAPLHSIMNGLQKCSLLHHEVPSNVMEKLQIELTKALRNLDDHMGNLLCLAIFARLSSSRPQNLSNKHGPEPPSWLLNIQHFFGPKRGLKTLDLVVLRVILACSANCNLNPSQAAESIRLAISIADEIEPEQKTAWISGNSSKIAKLCEKVAKDGLHPEIQMMGVAFILCVLPTTNVPSHIRELGFHVLLSKGSRGPMGLMPHHLIPRIAQSLATDESTIYHLLRFVFESMQTGALPDRNSLSDIQLANMILLGFLDLNSSALSSAILDSVSTQQAIANLLEVFPVIPSQHCEGLDTCHHALAMLRNDLALKLFEVYFGVALSRGENNSGLTIMRSFVHRTARTLDQSTCEFSVFDRKAYQGQTGLNLMPGPKSSKVNRDWRSRLTESFEQNALASHDKMMKNIEEVCYDLERRCYDIEGPLRLAEEERDKTIMEKEELQRQTEYMEKELEQSAHVLSDLKQENFRLVENSESTSAEIQGLSMSLDAAKHELEAQSKLIENISRDKEIMRTRELELIAISTAKDDQLEELQEDMHRFQSENERLTHALNSASNDQAASLQKSTALQSELSELKERFEESSLICARKEDEVQRLLADGEDIRMEMGTLKATVEEQTLEAEKLHSTLQEVESKCQLEVTKLRDQHETETIKLKTELGDIEQDNSRLRFAIQEAAYNAANEVQTKDKRISQLERKIQSLRDERAAKAREFSEAQQHIGRLMNVMGFAPNQQNSAPNKHQRTKSSEHNNLDHAGQLAYDEDDTQLAESFDYMAFEHRERSPKRPKGIRRSVHPGECLPPKTPAKLNPKSTSQGVETPKASSPRKPLEEISSNSPSKSRSSEIKQTKPRTDLSPTDKPNCLQNIDLDTDLEFSQDFIFTNTAFPSSNDGNGLQQ